MKKEKKENEEKDYKEAVSDFLNTSYDYVYILPSLSLM